MEKNLVEPQHPDSTNLSQEGDGDNEIIQSFLELQSKWAFEEVRQDKMDEIEEDKGILEDLTRRVNFDVKPTIKPSLYFKLLRIYDIQASDLPKTSAKKAGESDADMAIANSVMKTIYDEAGVEDVYIDVIQRMKTEGTAIVQVGFSDNGEYIPVETCELGEIYLDTSVNTIASHANMKGRVAKTIIRQVDLKYSDFINLFPDMADKVLVGTPKYKEEQEVFDRDMDGTTDDDSKKISLFYCYTIQDAKNPIQAIFAGANAVLCEPIKEGKKYPFWRKRNGKDVPFLPFIDFHYSLTKRGFYSMSMIGMMKDIAETYRRMLNAALPLFHKAVNKIIFLFGAEDDQTVEEMQLAYEQQKLGLNPMIAVENGVDMKTVGVDTGIFQDFALAKQEVFAEASDRFDIDFQRLSQDTVKATVFVGKTKTELQAIAGLYQINKSKFDLLAEYTVSLASRHWDINDTRIIDVEVSDSETITITLGEALEMFEGFDGYFDTDTDLKLPSSTADTANAMTEMENLVMSVFYGRPYTTVDEIQLEIDSLAKRARLRDIDDVYNLKTLRKKAELILKAKQQEMQKQMEQQQMIQPPAPNPDEGLGEDVKEELSPQAFIAEQQVV